MSEFRRKGLSHQPAHHHIMTLRNRHRTTHQKPVTLPTPVSAPVTTRQYRRRRLLRKSGAWETSRALTMFKVRWRIEDVLQQSYTFAIFEQEMRPPICCGTRKPPHMGVMSPSLPKIMQ
ncbi:unnamed protein product [Nesidiocoris tenuis]|uniref:Uncharacterized protein n=1 Tax=Nesidiocoris tenuis TaxID=355587 RepID=A0A6H5GGJ4_9HEMI|nr:unnamed protein product [Nesidiocoris tenuis]